MSDSTQGPGWWQASDGKWYPPEQHPGGGAPTEAVESTPPTAAMPPVSPPAGGPPVVPAGPPPGPMGGPPPGSSNAKWVVLGVVAAAIIAIAAFLLLKGDDKKQPVAANSSSASSTSSSSSSRSSSSRSSSSSSSSSSGQITAAELQRRLLTASDIGSDFHDSSFQTDNTSPTPCGQKNTNIDFPPDIDVGSQATNTARDLFFQEEVLVYADAQTASQAFDAGKEGVSCTQGTSGDGTQITFSAPKDVTSDFDAEEAIEIDFQGTNLQGQIFALRSSEGIAVFQFQGTDSADTSQLPDPTTIVKKGIDKLSG